MPIFEYSCKKCGTRFEALVHGDERVACESCGSRSLEKLFSAFAVGNQALGKMRNAAMPPCAGECSGGFNRGTCGSGMCGAH